MPAFLDAPVSGAYHLVHWIAVTFEPLTGPYSAALAIVLCTVAVRLFLLPLSVRAARGAKSRTALLPQIKELSDRHKHNPERLNREIAALQAESGSVFAGCLPMLAQLPFFWVMYRLFSTAVVAGQSNQLLSGTLFGAPLGLPGRCSPQPRRTSASQYCLLSSPTSRHAGRLGWLTPSRPAWWVT
jgi:YidC/Oxa1 family membrane protein insertase